MTFKLEYIQNIYNLLNSNVVGLDFFWSGVYRFPRLFYQLHVEFKMFSFQHM